jgi:hypothetical protein
MLSYELADTAGISAPPGPLVVLLAAALFAFSSGLQRLRGRRA